MCQSHSPIKIINCFIAKLFIFASVLDCKVKDFEIMLPLKIAFSSDGGSGRLIRQSLLLYFLQEGRSLSFGCPFNRYLRKPELICVNCLE